MSTPCLKRYPLHEAIEIEGNPFFCSIKNGNVLMYTDLLCKICADWRCRMIAVCRHGRTTSRSCPLLRFLSVGLDLVGTCQNSESWWQLKEAISPNSVGAYQTGQFVNFALLWLIFDGHRKWGQMEKTNEKSKRLVKAFSLILSKLFLKIKLIYSLRSDMHKDHFSSPLYNEHRFILLYTQTFAIHYCKYGASKDHHVQQS